MKWIAPESSQVRELFWKVLKGKVEVKRNQWNNRKIKIGREDA